MSSRPTPSAWSQPIQAKWRQEKLQKSSTYVSVAPSLQMQSADFKVTNGPEWPSLPLSQPVKETSPGSPPSAWSQPIQTQWQQQLTQRSTARQRSSNPSLARVQSADLPTYPPEKPQSSVLRKRYSADLSDSSLPIALMSDRQLKRNSDPPPPIQSAGCHKDQMVFHHMCVSVDHETTVKSSQVEPEVPSYLQLSLPAQLSRPLPSLGDNVFAGIGNMVRIQ